MWDDKWGGRKCTQEAHSGWLSFGPKQFRLRLSVSHAKINFVLSVMNKNIKTIGLPSRIFSRFVFMREISTPEL